MVKILKVSLLSYIHNFLLFGLILVFILLFSLSEFSQLQFSWIIEMLVVLIGIYLLLEPLNERISKTYMLTDSGIIERKGIFSIKEVNILYSKISDVRLEQSFLGRILNFGDVVISSEKYQIVMKGIRSPREIYEFVKKRTGQ